MKPIIVSPHAFERIHERKITRTEVEATIRASETFLSAKRGRIRVSRKFESKILDVFYKEIGSAIIFVTAYWRKR